jgi:hypothetical protein
MNLFCQCQLLLVNLKHRQFSIVVINKEKKTFGVLIECWNRIIFMRFKIREQIVIRIRIRFRHRPYDKASQILLKNKSWQRGRRCYFISWFYSKHFCWKYENGITVSVSTFLKICLCWTSRLCRSRIALQLRHHQNDVTPCGSGSGTNCFGTFQQKLKTTKFNLWRPPPSCSSWWECPPCWRALGTSS